MAKYESAQWRSGSINHHKAWQQQQRSAISGNINRARNISA